MPPSQNRIRHISAVHVRNLTPFPARDTLVRHFSDDIERISTDKRPPSSVIQSRLVESFIAITIPCGQVSSSTPDYLSSIHRPSTNPSFLIDPQFDFPEWTDRGSQKLMIEAWAKVANPKTASIVSAKGKEKESVDFEWKILDEWTVDLSELVPVPEEVSTSQLPSNTLILTLDRDYHLPPPPSRSPTPTAGYLSDPETHARDHKPNRRRMRRPRIDSKDLAYTASWQDLFKLVTLQTCILDNQASLTEIVRSIDSIIREDNIFALRREVSMRESRLEELRQEYKTASDRCTRLRTDISQRREHIQQRKELLSLANAQHDENIRVLMQMKDVASEEAHRLQMLQSRLAPTRTTLLSTLAFIFPIELLSPPDLLFTILDVPLPIPLSSNEPAPPLSLPSHKEVTEESVATSLGYAAQLVQLLSTYLGKGLVYPVTCVGSRSLIRDGISAMVGPRMFPLFSKGVDTYRFEYGVFLLNKDVEILMADQELRALDMRHTLPNLKNLLLTLTSGEGAPLGARRSDSPISAVSGLESLQSEPQEPSTPKASQVVTSSESTTPPHSGSTTPTTNDTVKKARPFLGLSFPSGFLRSRSSKGTWENDGVQENGPDDHTEIEQVQVAEEDDRRTIRGDDGEAKIAATHQTAEEKARTHTVPSIPSTPVTAVIK